MKLSCAICDDEAFAVKGMAGYVDQVDFLQLEGTFNSAIDLNSYLNSHAIDLIFLDIQMPFMTGIELLKSLKDPPMVIFTTAFDKYAVEGYELDILDFLLKPVSFDRFLKAANKAYQYKMISANQQQEAGYFFVKCGYRLEKIFLDDVLFVEGMQNYLQIYTRQQKLIAYLTMKAIVEQLPADKFIQTHKSFLVAIDKVEAIEGNQIIIGKHKVSISKYQKEEVLEQIVNKNLLKRK